MECLKCALYGLNQIIASAVEECENDSPLRRVIPAIINFSAFNDYFLTGCPANFIARLRAVF